jgi:serine/threonine-protein kinase HipA
MDVAVVEWQAEGFARMEYLPEFVDFAHSGAIELSPVMMPVAKGVIYQFPELARSTFKGLPGLLADSLPDRFGHLLIDHWVTLRKIDPNDFNPVDRLCYIGQRGMGALEFAPSEQRALNNSEIDLNDLVQLCNAILSEKTQQQGHYDGNDMEQTVADMVMIGSSAGGAKAKAVIAWNPDTGSIKSGQLDSGSGYQHWIIKFDGITADGQYGNASNHCRMEYAYYLLAQQAGLQVPESRLLASGERAHFMTRRFDRRDNGEKVHVQTLAGLAHMDPANIGANSYEAAMMVAAKLGLSNLDRQQIFRQAAFNAYFKNHDDHSKNLSFCMDKAGQWALSPAYDLTYHYFSGAVQQSQHAMSINGKFRDIDRADLLALAAYADIKAATAKRILDQIIAAASQWQACADQAGVSAADASYAGFNFGLS